MAFTIERLPVTAHYTVDQNGKFVKRYTTPYLVKSDSVTENTEDEVFAALNVQPGAPYANWAAARANDFNCTKKLTRPPHQAWDVSIGYSTDGVVPEDGGAGGIGSTDPVDFRVRRRLGISEQQRFIIKDKNGLLIVDAAGSPYDGGVPITDYWGWMEFVRNEPHSTDKMAQSVLYSGKLNSVTFMGCAPETLMLVCTGDEKYEGGYHFWTFTYTMTYNKEGWQPQPLNAGLWYLLAGVRTRITEGDGTNTLEPQPLTALGAVVPVASRPAGCTFRDIDYYNTFDFADLNLPTT